MKSFADYRELEEAASPAARFNQKVKQAQAAHEAGDHKKAKYHLDTARSFMLGINSNDHGKIKDSYPKYKELRDLHKEEVELDEAVKIGTKVKIHAPGKDYHGEVGHVGEIRHGAYKGAPKTYTVDYGDRKSIQLDKKEVKVHKEEVELDEDFKKGDFIKTPTGEVHRVFDVKGNSLETAPYRGKNGYGGGTTVHKTKATKVPAPKDVTEEVDQLEEMTQGKEYTQAQLQKKIQSGNWEATHDIKPGKHVEMRHHSGKRVVVQVKEESELGDLAHQKTLKHRFLVTYSDPNHTSTSMRKEKQQKHVLVPGTKNGESVYKGDAEPLVKKYMKKQGYKVHEIEHVGMVSKKVNEDTKLDEADGKDYHSVHVNGRMWKTFDSKSHADNVAKKIKGATVHKYDAERLQQNYGAKAAARNAARGKQWDENTTTENKTL